MLALKPLRSKAAGVADLLCFAALIDGGVVLTKEGALIAGWFFRGPDVASMTPEEKNYRVARLNTALAGRGSGWAWWFDASRLAAASYPSPTASHFPDPISAMIDGERRRQFLREGAHFETEHALTIMYTPPLRRQSRIVEWVYDDDDPEAQPPPSDRHIAMFNRVRDEIEDVLGDLLQLRRMGSFTIDGGGGTSPRMQDELVNYLHYCVTGQLTGIDIPNCAMYLDALIGGQELWTGDTPRIGETFIACVAIEGFPSASWPFMTETHDKVPVAHRFSSRFIALDQHLAISELHAYRRRWGQWKRSFLRQVFRTPGGYVNEDAATMERQAESAITDANSALVSFGYYTPVLTLMGPNRAELMDGARALAREIGREGFACRVETVNTMEAWLGSIPGHSHPNVRRPLIHSLNLADLAPASSKYAGRDIYPSPQFPANSPPLMHAATTGATPFRLNLHVGDVGHTLVLGPTGAGKSTLLCMIAAQFLRYEAARITVFDKGRSMLALALAVAGRHYELTTEDGVTGICPLAFTHEDTEAAWAEDWIAACCELQTGSPPSPAQTQQIRRAITILAQGEGGEGRTLTDFCATVQDQAVRDAMRYYTLGNPLGNLLDARADGIAGSHLTVFELDEVMGFGPRGAIPVLLTLFRRFERSLTGAPALLILDEAWVMLGHNVFAAKLREWLKTLRKANCAVVLATQSLSDAARSDQLDVLLESCPTKILLPNEEATRAGTPQVMGPRDLYALFGLNAVEIDIIANAAKKRDYYVISPEGRRLIDLGLGPIALAFAGVSAKEDVARIKELAASHGEGWPSIWLEEKGVSDEPV
jgi:type IV secretion/conjugal transfer VirB4 family ATPase